MMKLIGKDMFAIDVCKMPSNASKKWSGTKVEFVKKMRKMERAIRRILKKHRETDIEQKDVDVVEKAKQYIQTLRGQIKKLSKWLDDNDEKPGKTGKPRKSNITDTQKMKHKIDSDHGRMIYIKRAGTVDPVFAHLRHAIGLTRFTLRGDPKVNIQWKLLNIFHNLLKIHRFGPGFT